MGGCVTILLREPNGATTKMLRWTNAVPEFLTDPRMYSPDPQAWVDDFMEKWRAMAADYQAHKRDGRYIHNMTPVFFPWDANAPSEYGLVVLDLQSKAVLSMQTFCMEPMAVDLQSLRLRDARFEHAHQLVLNGLMQNLWVRRNADEEWKCMAIPKAQREAGFQEIVKLADSGRLEGTLPITPPGFAMQHYPYSLDGAVAMKCAMRDLGFDFSAKEERLWQSWADRFVQGMPEPQAEAQKRRLGLDAAAEHDHSTIEL